MNLTVEKDIDDILNEKNDWNQYDSSLYGLDHREKQQIEVTENPQELEEEKEEEVEEEREKASLTEEEIETDLEDEMEKESLKEINCPICHQTANKPNHQ